MEKSLDDTTLHDAVDIGPTGERQARRSRVGHEGGAGRHLLWEESATLSGAIHGRRRMVFAVAGPGRYPPEKGSLD